jgi:putative hydrolase of the HAD superfamily
MSAAFRGVRSVLFDAGGTLIHLDGERICRTAGVDADSASFRRAELASLNAMRAWIAANPASTDRERIPVFFEGILSRLGIADADACRAACRAVLAEHDRSNLWSAPGAGASTTLAALGQRGYRMGVVSNADGRVRRLLEDAGLAPHLEVVVDSFEVGVEKPDPRIFHAATGKLGTPPSECLYVGDIYEIDVLGARAAGLQAVLIGAGEAPESDPVVRIASLPDLLPLLP